MWENGFQNPVFVYNYRPYTVIISLQIYNFFPVPTTFYAIFREFTHLIPKTRLQTPKNNIMYLHATANFCNFVNEIKGEKWKRITT